MYVYDYVTILRIQEDYQRLTAMMIIVLVILSLWWMFVVVQDLPDHMTKITIQVCVCI